MTIGHRAAERDQRRATVARLYLQRRMQSDIARELGMSQQQVSYDLKIIRQAWLAAMVRDFDALKSEQLAVVDAVEREAWQAWSRSCQPREVTLTEAIEGGERPTTRKASVRKEGQAGDPRFLERIQKCIEQRCDLLGLNAPKRLTVDLERCTDDQLRRLWAGTPVEVIAAELDEPHGMAEA